MKRQLFSLMLLSVIMLGAMTMSGCKDDDPVSKEFTVTFDMNGSTDGSVTPQTVKEGEKAAKPTDPSRTGYTFKGWFKEAAGTNEWNFGAEAITANVTLYAKWEAIPEPVYYTVQFDSKGGSEVTAQYVLGGEKATEPSIPSLANYDFKGWFKDDALTQAWNFGADAVTADITLYAKFEEIPLMDGEPATIFVEAGEFMMGSTGDEPNMSDEMRNWSTPRHKVTLTRNYKIGKFEVTQAEWETIMGDWTPSRLDRGIGDNNPIYDVSMNDILGRTGKSVVVDNVTYYEDGYIYKLRELTGKPYRLPTEAEWEFAARGGKSGQGYLYSGSNTLEEVANIRVYSTYAVGQLKANELGIYDMTGNVNEFVSDIWYSPYPDADQQDPKSVDAGTYPNDSWDSNGDGEKDTDSRVHRGGDHGDSGGKHMWHIGFRMRLNYAPGSSPYIGFRVALDVPVE